MLAGDSVESLMAPPASAVPGCAVLYRDDGGKEHWVVLEDENAPMPSLDEVGPSTELGKSLLGRAVQCERCGAADLDLDQMAHFERRAAHLVLVEAKSVGGPELRFARKALGLRQEDLARALECNPQQVSRWEHSESIDMRLRLAVAALLEHVEQGKSLDGLARDEGEELRLAV